MANKGKRKPPEDEAVGKENSLAFEVGRIGKLFALYVLKDVSDESKKIVRLNAAGFTVPEISALLHKTEANVRVQISQAKKRLGN